MADTSKIVNVTLEERRVLRRSPEVEHERQVAIYDLIQDNIFELMDGPPGPYHLHLSKMENRLTFDIHDGADGPMLNFRVPVTPFRSVIRDYFTVCESYYSAIRSQSPQQIEAIDMGRRGLHNEGADLLRDLLVDKRVVIDDVTARRLFTLICVLHIRGDGQSGGRH